MLEWLTAKLRGLPVVGSSAVDTEFEAAHKANSSEAVVHFMRTARTEPELFGEGDLPDEPVPKAIDPAWYGTAVCLWNNVSPGDLKEFHGLGGVILDRPYKLPYWPDRMTIRPSERLMEKVSEAHSLGESVHGKFEYETINNPWWESVRLIDAAETAGVHFDAKALQAAQKGNEGDVVGHLQESLHDLRGNTGHYVPYRQRMEKAYG